ncbi:LOW QUALITY PROTEIN: PHD finger protein 7-like [Rhea pennata]|uniref:LOW QUALITY PROTEIN: PHD finger protein 7-like n=1 Tax=Rhea pennata TaxID=8795 RepID=UPI002E26DA3C
MGGGCAGWEAARRRALGLCWRSGAGRGGAGTCPTALPCSSQGCFVCGERGAAISCQQKGCSRTFHLPCASEHGCVTQFFRPYRSFCWEHRPEQAVPARPTAETTCIICQEPVDEQLSYRTMVCPACKGAWFHRGCIQVGALPWRQGHGGASHSAPLTLPVCLLQGQAVHAGFSCFRCPLCKNRRRFLPEMFKMGISIPFRGPSWEEGGRYRDLYQRHRRCDAARCLHPRGREQAEPSGGSGSRCLAQELCRALPCCAPSARGGLAGITASSPSHHRHQPVCLARRWELLLCSSCAAQGAHRGCSGLGNAAVSWECDECAGLGPGKRHRGQGPAGWGWGWGQAWQQVLSAALQQGLCLRQGRGHRSGLCSPGAVLLTFLPPLAASSAQPEPAAPSTSSQAEPAASSSSAAPRTRSPSGGTGPERRPSRSRLARRSQNPYRRP